MGRTAIPGRGSLGGGTVRCMNEKVHGILLSFSQLLTMSNLLLGYEIRPSSSNENTATQSGVAVRERNEIVADQSGHRLQVLHQVAAQFLGARFQRRRQELIIDRTVELLVQAPELFRILSL